MLPSKRTVEGEAVDGDSKIDSNSSRGCDSERGVKKLRIEGSVLATSTENRTRGSEVEISGGGVDLGSSSNGNDSGDKSVTEMAFDDGNPHDIDEDLHSRQLAVYGRETMRRLFASNILVSGMQGLGVEIAKNLILAGVKSVTLHDEGSIELWDLSSNFIFSENDIGKNRALASVQKLQELNNAVVVTALSTKLTKEQLSDFQNCINLVGLLQNQNRMQLHLNQNRRQCLQKLQLMLLLEQRHLYLNQMVIMLESQHRSCRM